MLKKNVLLQNRAQQWDRYLVRRSSERISSSTTLPRGRLDGHTRCSNKFIPVKNRRVLVILRPSRYVFLADISFFLALFFPRFFLLFQLQRSCPVK